MKSLAWFLLALSMAMALPDCGSRPTDPPTSTLTGPWGAEQVGLVLAPTGGRLVSSCSEGWIDQPVRPDANGEFRAQGTFAAGPVPVIRPVEFSGRITGDEMQLSVLDMGTRIPLVTYTLQRGVEWDGSPQCL